MKCSDVRSLFSAYMDRAMTGRQMRDISTHLDGCVACKDEFALITNTQKLVSTLGKKKAPADLALKIRVALSQEMAQRRRKPFEGIRVRFENAFNAFMVPATAGMVTAIIIFGLLIGILYPVQMASANDVPTMLYTPPELASSPFGLEIGSLNAESLVIEASIDQNGRVQDYRILSAPNDSKEIIPELNKMMIFTTFRPATSFGRPTVGRAILSFSRINVKG